MKNQLNQKHSYNFCKLITVSLLLTSFNVNAALFGASNYDDCALEVSKTAKTDAAVRVGIAACRSKFKGEEKTQKHNVPNKIEPCYLYWDGFKFVKGKTTSDYFVEYTFPYYGVDAVRMALPKPLTIELGLNKSADWKNNPKQKSFFVENFFPQAQRLCSLY